MRKLLTRKHIVLILSVFATLLYMLLSTTRLDAQGLYYDELHQATASFAYINKPPSQFAQLVYHGIPVMNMNYSGAMKTGIYGLYLRLFDASFSVISWRLVGILLVAIALFLFGIITSKNFPLIGIISFYFFVITDITILLTTRHDWGPVALSLCFRIILVGLWIRGELSGVIPKFNSLLLGAFVGISIFEKLSAAVLIIPLLFFILLSPKRRTFAHFFATLLGGFIGTFPLLMANLISFHQNRYFISLEFDQTKHTLTMSGISQFATNYLSLGGGEAVRSFILGKSTHIYSIMEITFLFLVICSFLVRFSFRRKNVYYRLSAIMLLSYVLVFVGLYLLPQNIWAHHWVIGTPFQYMSIALFLTGLSQEDVIRNWRIKHWAIVVLMTLFIGFRIVGVTSLQQSLIEGDSNGSWDPSLTQIGKFAAERSNDSIFIAANWGTANQMICFLNGQPGVVYQTDWTSQGFDYISSVIGESKVSQAYIVIYSLPNQTFSPGWGDAIATIEQSLHSQWIEQPAEQELDNLNSVKVIKLTKIPSN